MSRRRFFTTLGVGAAGVAAARWVGSHTPTLRVTHHTRQLGLKDPIRVVHLTDVHVGVTTPKAILSRAASIATEAKPDLVVLTGDYVNHSLVHADRLRAWLRELPRPIVATLGNHDHWAGSTAVAKALTEEGVTVLSNESMFSHELDLRVIGVDDGRTGRDDVPKAFRGVKTPHKSLVLSHDPRTANAISESGAGLVLSGHTHGGHVTVPKITPTVAKWVGQVYLSGAYDLGESHLYVNAGLGHSRRGLRAGEPAAAEVAIFDLS